jgi:hypothetical protein
MIRLIVFIYASARLYPISVSALQAAQVSLRMLITTLVPSGELVIGIDDTIERRRGQKIKAKGIYRDPARSSHSHFVKASGLRCLCR